MYVKAKNFEFLNLYTGKKCGFILVQKKNFFETLQNEYI